MIYQTYKPDTDLQTKVKCYWTLEVPAHQDARRQLILPDGCIDMCFTLGDDIKRYTTDNDFVIQPRQMLLGQITEQFYVEPTGYVNTFAIRFYPYGFANFIDLPLNKLANKETPLNKLFGDNSSEQLSQKIIQAKTTNERIEIIESFLFERLKKKATIDNIVKSTIDAMFLTKGSKSLNAILKDDLPKRRQLERNFNKQTGKIGYQELKGERKYAGPGETVLFKVGVPHKFWNAGNETLSMSGYVSPANNLVYFLSQIYRSMNENGGRPGINEAAFLLGRYKTEFRMLEIPAFVQNLIFPVTLFFGNLTGMKKKFVDAPDPL